MMKVNINVETMNRVLEVLRPLCGTAEYVRFDFGTSKIAGANGVPDVMRSKVSVATGTEQVEMALTTLVPTEIERPLEECSLKNPLETVVVVLPNFVAVADALSQYGEAFELETDSAKVMLSAGTAHMPVYRVDPSVMKALVPHRQNSGDFHLFDTDVMTIRFMGKEFLEAAKTAACLQKKVEMESLKNYVVSVLDIPPVTQEVEKDGKKFNVVKYNASVQLAGTDRFAFAGGATNAFIHKGAGADLVSVIKDRTTLEGVESPIISFVKEGEEIKPSIVSFSDFKKEYDAARGVDSGEEFRFAIPMDAMDRIVRLVSVNPEAYVDVTVGKKYLFVTFMGLGAIYMCAQKTLSGTSYVETCRGFVAGMENFVSVDSKAVQSSLKLAQLYQKDALISQMPIELQFEKQGITMKRGESESLIKAISADTKMDLVSYGVNGDYISCVTGGLPSGTIQIGYGDKPIMVFTKGGEKPSPLGSWIVVSGVADLEASKRQVEEAYRKAIAEKEKKEKEKKN